MNAPATLEREALGMESYRADFPALAQEVHGKPLAFLDSAASTLKPRVVIDAVESVYARDCANIHRAVHLLSQRATMRYEESREKVRAFINAAAREEIIFTRGTTESINLVAASWGMANLKPGDEIVISALEHHSNIVPWQMVAEQTGAKLVVIPITDAGEVLLEEVEKALGPRTELVAVAHISNALGTILPVAKIIEMGHAVGAKVLIDGAQGVPHGSVDVRALDADFYAFSGHKLYGPTGIGVLYAKQALLEAMPPYQGGGDMIRTVSFEKTTYAELPNKFEAGTPNIAGAIGLGAAIDYVSTVGLDRVAAHEASLLDYATDAVSSIEGLRLIGTAKEKGGVLSFVMKSAHPHDIGTIVDAEGVAIRTGHHCAQPVMERYGVAATARASFGLYNNRADVDALIRALHRVQEMFG